jgi:hypothetical protein
MAVFHADPDRGKLAVTRDLDYEVRCHERHIKYLSQVLMATRFFSAAVAAIAVATGFGGQPRIGVVLSLVVVLANEWADAYDVRDRRAQHRVQRGRILGLLTELPNMSVEDLDAQRADIAKDDPVFNDALRIAAFNDNLRTHGYRKEDPEGAVYFLCEGRWCLFMRAVS